MEWARRAAGRRADLAGVGLLVLAAMIVASAPAAAAQALFDSNADMQPLRSVGWHGFLDGNAMLGELGALVLATALGALIAFHPMTPRTVDTLEEAELPKIYIMYALIGAVIGVVVLQYGIIVGLVIFGLGGIMRFRTDVGSTRDTGRLIVVTLVGLVSGLNLPHFAVLTAVFAYIMIFFLDAHPICRIVVKDLQAGKVPAAAAAYRDTLSELGCKVLSERKHHSKPRVDIVFRAPRNSTLDLMHAELNTRVPPDLRGEVDWEVD